MDDNIFGVASDAAEPAPGDTAPPAPGAEPQDDPQDSEPTDPPAPAAETNPAPSSDGPALPEEDEDKEFLAENESSGFRIGNKVYKDIDAADHVFRQFRGRAQAAEQRRKDAEARAAEVAAERDRLASAFELLKSQSAQQPPKQDDKGTPATPPPPAKPKRLTDLVKPEEFEALIAGDAGPGGAFKKLAEFIDSRLDEALEETTRDSKPFFQRKELAEKTADLFDSAAALTDAAGKPVYPELVDPTSPVAEAVFGIYQRNTQDRALAPLALTQHGVQIAINEYRAANGQPAPQGPRTPAGAAVVARRAADASLRGMGTDGRSSVRSGPGPVENNEERYQRLNRSRQHEVFGVTAERA